MPAASPALEQRIDVRQAANAAMDYFKSLFPTVRRFSLEEVELSEDGKHWLITLGFEVPKSSPDVDALFLPPKTKYKVFKVDVRTGRVLAMKIRSLG